MHLKAVLALLRDEETLADNAEHILRMLTADQRVFGGGDDADVHKFKVRVSALLKSKRPVSRWFATYLARAAVESSWEVLESHGATWAGIMVHMLEVSEPDVTILAALAALGTIFSKTAGKAELTRKITTPRLPEYVKLVLRRADSPRLALACLAALTRVLRQQSTTFRPHAAATRALVVRVLDRHAGGRGAGDERLLAAATEAFVCLPMAEPKDKEAELWRSSLLEVVREAHGALSDITEGNVNEDAPPATGGPTLGLTATPTNALQRWRVCVRLLKAFFTVATKTQVKVPLGAVVALVDRVYALNAFASFAAAADRGLLVATFDGLHADATQVLLTVQRACGQQVLAHFSTLWHYYTTLADAHKPAKASLILSSAATLLRQASVAPRHAVQGIDGLADVALRLLDSQAPRSSLPDFVSNPAAFAKPATGPERAAVEDFLVALVDCVPQLPAALRARIDRYFILAHSTRGLGASALYPGNAAKYSIAPMAMREPTVALSPAMGVLIHPRLPPLHREVHTLPGTARLPAETENGQTQPEIPVPDAVPEVPIQPVQAAQSIQANSLQFSTVSEPAPAPAPHPAPVPAQAPQAAPAPLTTPAPQPAPKPVPEPVPQPAIDQPMADAQPDFSADGSDSDSDIEIPAIDVNDSDDD